MADEEQTPPPATPATNAAPLFSIVRQPQGVTFVVSPELAPDALLALLMSAIDHVKPAAAQHAAQVAVSGGGRIQLAPSMPRLHV